MKTKIIVGLIALGLTSVFSGCVAPGYNYHHYPPVYYEVQPPMTYVWVPSYSSHISMTWGFGYFHHPSPRVYHRPPRR
jgi:hypothetical protein